MKKIFFFFALFICSWPNLYANQSDSLPFKVGEHLTYSLKRHFAGIDWKVGKITTVVVEKIDYQGQSVFHFLATFHLEKFFSIFLNEINVQIDVYSNEKDLSFYYFRFYNNGLLLEVFREKDLIRLKLDDKKDSIIIKKEWNKIYDILSLAYFIRSNLQIKKIIYFDIIKENISFIDVSLKKRVKIKTVFGKRECFLIQGKIDGERIKVFIDQNRFIQRIEYGPNRIILEEIK